MPATVFADPKNNVATTLQLGHPTGSGTFVVASGDGALFGTTYPVRFTVVRLTAFDASGKIVDPTKLAIFKCTARTNDTLTVGAAQEGTHDQPFEAGDIVCIEPTAGTFNDIHGAINTLESTVESLSGVVEGHTATLAGHTSAITAIGDDVTNQGATIAEHGTLIAAQADEIAGKQPAGTYVNTVASRSGAVTLTTTDIGGLGSIATHEAGDYLTPTGNGSGLTGITESQVSGLVGHLASKAPMDSPGLTGIPTAPTAAGGTNTTQISSTAFVRGEIAALVGSAPSILDTLGEIATQLQSDESAAAALVATVAGKQPAGDYLTPTGVGSALAVTATGTTTARTLAARSIERFNVRDYGAVADGTTDDLAALQAAADAAYAAGGGMVVYPRGVYGIKPTTVAGVKLNTGVHVRGEPGATLKILPGTGNFRMMMGQDYSHSSWSDISIRGLHFDLNAAGNSGYSINITDGGTVQKAIHFDSIESSAPCSDITVSDCTFDACGYNVISFSGDGHSRIVVARNTIRWVRGVSLSEYDHTSIYVDGDTTSITDNVLVTSIDQHAGTGIETHGGPSEVSGNTVRRYVSGAYVVPASAGSGLSRRNNINVHHNRFVEVNFGVMLWPTSTMRGVSVDYNQIDLSQIDHNYYISSGVGVMMDASIAGPIEEFTIAGNVIVYQPGDSRTVGRLGNPTNIAYGAAIAFPTPYGVRHGVICDNIVRNAPSVGILLSYGSGDFAHLTITGNRFINVGSNTTINQYSRTVFYAFGSQATDIRIEDNSLVDTGTSGLVGVHELVYDPSSAVGVTYLNNRQSLSQSTRLATYYPDDTKPINRGYGTTVQRPAAPLVGDRWFDTTLGTTIQWTGSDWAGVASYLSNTFTDTQTITPPAGSSGVVVRGHSGQTAHLQSWQNSGGTDLSVVTADGFGYFQKIGAGKIPVNALDVVGTFGLFDASQENFVSVAPGTTTFLGVSGDLWINTGGSPRLIFSGGTVTSTWPFAATEIQVGGAKVVGGRGDAVADATDATSAVTQLNALLVRLRAHGLIAT